MERWFEGMDGEDEILTEGGVKQGECRNIVLKGRNDTGIN